MRISKSCSLGVFYSILTNEAFCKEFEFMDFSLNSFQIVNLLILSFTYLDIFQNATLVFLEKIVAKCAYIQVMDRNASRRAHVLMIVVTSQMAVQMNQLVSAKESICVSFNFLLQMT